MTASRYFVVWGHRSDRELRAYLYDHSFPVLTTTDGMGRNVAVVQTVAGEDGRAMYLAQYQADRCASGMMGVTTPTTDYAEARAQAFQV